MMKTNPASYLWPFCLNTEFVFGIFYVRMQICIGIFAFLIENFMIRHIGVSGVCICVCASVYVVTVLERVATNCKDIRNML